MIAGGEENGETLYICRGFHDVSYWRLRHIQLLTLPYDNRAASVSVSEHHFIDASLLTIYAEVGKASTAFNKGAVIGYGHDEIHVRPALCLIYRA